MWSSAVDEPEFAPILPDLEKSLVKSRADADAAVRALARRYAMLLDEAAVKQAYATALKALDKVVAHFAETWRNPSDVTRAENALATITVALGQHSVASDLGPKLLAALQQLGLTPAARKEQKGDQQPSADPLAEFQQEEQRLRLVPGGQH